MNTATERLTNVTSHMVTVAQANGYRLHHSSTLQRTPRDTLFFHPANGEEYTFRHYKTGAMVTHHEMQQMLRRYNGGK